MSVAVRRALFAVLLLSVAAFFYAAGVISYRYRLFPVPQLVLLKSHYFSDSVEYSNSAGRSIRPCQELAGDRTAVVLTAGQSNAGNYGEARHRCRHEVWNFYRGRCYRAEDPLLGAGGVGGSVWSRAGDGLIEAGLFDRVVIVPAAIGTTTMNLWAPGGPLHSRLVRAAREARDAGLPLTHFFWIQGESEPRGGGDAARRAYVKGFEGILRSLAREGARPVTVIAVSTFNGGGFYGEIRQAQMELSGAGKALRGPDLDAFTQADLRWETVHLSGKGLDRAAALWVEAMRRAGRKTISP